MDTKENKGLRKYLSPLSAWALSFGCAVGWGSFVMPGTTFLPMAGPLGTAIGIGLGAFIMLIIGMNYHYMMNRYPDSGGTLIYSTKTFGYDHGYLSAWFMILVYVAIIWANATALTLICRNLFGSALQFGFHYEIQGYQIYFGETLLSILAILIFGSICIIDKVLAVRLQVLASVVMILGIGIVFFNVASNQEVSLSGFRPFFAYGDMSVMGQVSTIVALSPWAFVGFESISNSTESFKFSAKKAIWIFLASLLTGAAFYIMLSTIAAAIHPPGFESWTDYVAALNGLDGLEGLPTFYVTNTVMGKEGLIILGFSCTAAIVTGLIGNFVAASRLLFAMARDGIMPKWFCKLDRKEIPRNALLALMLISVLVPLLGRTAIGWIVDVNTIGAVIAYGYTSASAFVTARADKNRFVQASGAIGFLVSLIFFFYFMSWSAGTMSTESYLILAAWSIFGFVYFRYIFKQDKKKRFGKSTIVWIGLLFLIFFTSLMWVKQSTEDETRDVVGRISKFYEEQYMDDDPYTIARTEKYLKDQLEQANKVQTRNSMIQMGIILVSLGIMFSIYTTISKREKKMEIEKLEALEMSQAKSTFLSNMSHDIRTPMNAILGYLNIAEKETSLAEVMKYISKIKASSQHLLALINDVLEMSRIESGKIELEPIKMDICKTFTEVGDMFTTQMNEKKIDFNIDFSQVRHRMVYCDKYRLNRVLLNLVSNAYKFTPEEGSIFLSLYEIECEEENYGKYEIRVKDSGIGMSKEFALKVFDAFERENNSTVSKIQGTGLGMSITKSIVDMMGGKILVNSEKGVGTEFIINLKLKIMEEAQQIQENSAEGTPVVTEVDFSKKRLLLVEDMEINREIALMILSSLGFMVETAENGREALEKVAASSPGYFDAVLMDIQMPVMDGYEAAREIRKLDGSLSQVPIIAMTANAFSEDVKKAEDAGMNGHVAKPIDVKVLTDTLRKILGRVEQIFDP